MNNNSQNKRVSIVIVVMLLFFYPSLVNARVSTAAAQVGSVVIIGGRTYVKITETNLWMDANKWDALGNTTMQGWDDCASLATPTGTNFTQGPILTDVRDNKTYEIRKFTDGKCWMVDNLMYGGPVDLCSGKTTFAGHGSLLPSDRFGAGTFGDCRDPRVGGVDPCTMSTTSCGYYYNWQAAMQHNSAYNGAAYVGSINGVRGLCPEGWRMPTGGAGGDFANLHSIIGSPSANFWQLTSGWKGVYSGICSATGTLINQGGYGYWWSSTPINTEWVYGMHYGVNYVSINYNDGYKANGFAIRCLKD